MPCCVQSGLKPRIGVRLHPSLKAGVNERQIVDNSILLVSKLRLLVSKPSGHDPSL